MNVCMVASPLFYRGRVFLKLYVSGCCKRINESKVYFPFFPFTYCSREPFAVIADFIVFCFSIRISNLLLLVRCILTHRLVLFISG